MSRNNPVIRIWSNRNYAWFMGGGVPSYLTSWMQRVGVGWLAWELTHSAAWLGAVAAADLAPMILLAAFAGAIADRHDPLKQMRISQFMLFLQAVALAVLQLAGVLTIEMLVLLSLWSGCTYPFQQTARHSVLASIVTREEFAPAIGVDSALFHSTRFVGPSLAGLIIPIMGVGSTFIAQAIGCLWFMVALLAMRVPTPERKQRARRSLLGDIRDGFVFVRRHPGIYPLFMMLTVVCVFLRPVQEMYPAFAGGIFHSDAVGLAWLNSATGVGALISAASIAMRGRVNGLTLMVYAGMFMFCLATLGFIASDQLWVGVIAAAFGGYALNSMTTSIQTLTQSAVDNDMRGRVMGLYSLIWRGTPALGALMVGFGADLIGIRACFVVSTVVCLGALAMALPRFGRAQAAMEHPHD